MEERLNTKFRRSFNLSQNKMDLILIMHKQLIIVDFIKNPLYYLN